MEKHGVFDVMLLTKTKIQSEAYSHNRLGYGMTCSTACPSSSGRAQGDIGLVMREWPVGWGVESRHYHGPNMASCEIVTGIIQTPLVGAYLTHLML